MNKNLPERFYTRESVAIYLGISRQYLNKLEKKIPMADRPGQHIYISRRDVDEWKKRWMQRDYANKKVWFPR